MKIAIFTDTFYPQINGVVTSLTDLAKGMTDRGHKVFIVAPEDKGDYTEFQYKDIEVLRLPAINASFYEGFKWSAIMHKPSFKKLKAEDIDIVHFMTPITVSVFGILVAKLLKKPMIGTYHTFISELSYIRQFFPHAGPATQKFAWQYSNAFYNRAHLITTPSDFTTNELIKNGCRQRVITVSNGINLSCFDNSKKDEIKAKYNPNGHIVLYVGRVSIEKNMMILLESYKEVCKTDKTTKFLIVGNGPFFLDSKAFVKEANLEDRIIFLGSIPNNELKVSGLFGASRLFVTASKTENQPVTVLEAKANGIPCIGPDSMGMPGVIEDNYSGFIVPKDDSKAMAEAIIKILSDDSLYEQFSKNCLESVKTHELGFILDEWEERYKHLIENPVRLKKHKSFKRVKASLKE